MKLLFPIGIAVLIGFGLGSIPVVNQHLHWNLWYVLPISGLILGMCLGGVQFYCCYVLNQPIHGWRMAVLALAACVSYVAIDYGIYHSATIPIKGVPGIPDGEHRFADLFSFPEYMQWRLGSSSVNDKHGKKVIEVGAALTTIQFLVDMAGAFFGALGALYLGYSTHPYCAPCSRFKRRAKLHVISFPFEEARFNEIMGQIATHAGSGSCAQVVAYLEELSPIHDKKGDVKISADERHCAGCGEVTVLGSVSRKGKDGQWQEITERAFKLNSQPGDLLPAEAPAIDQPASSARG